MSRRYRQPAYPSSVFGRNRHGRVGRSGRRLARQDLCISLTSDTALDLVGQFYAYDPVTFNGGTTVAVGLVTNNRDAQGHTYADIITGAGPAAARSQDLAARQRPKHGHRLAV